MCHSGAWAHGKNWQAGTQAGGLAGGQAGIDGWTDNRTDILRAGWAD